VTHDVIILGGGPNGLATALALGGSTLQGGLRVLLLDQKDPRSPVQDSRGTALTLSTQSMLKVLGVWDQLSPFSCEMRDVVVTDGDDQGNNRKPLLTLSTEAGQQAAASMVENSRLHQVLVAAVLKSPNITMEGGFEFQRFEVTPAKVKLIDSQDNSHHAALLVAADGRRSRVRQQLETKVASHDYGQTALGFSITIERPHQGRAEERFTSRGVFAVLPLPDLAASIVWGTSPVHAAELMSLDEAAFNAALQEEIGDHLGQVRLSSRRQAFPVMMQIAKDMVGPRIALLGDAAHAIHPLAGLGLNLGFKDAAALADCVMSTSLRGGDIGGPLVLENYQALRRFDTLSTSWMMDGLNGLFVNSDPALSPLRKAGLRLIDQFSGLKNTIMQQASGRSQNTPRLMRGLLPG
jgi:2-octaprenyl-6-methoxyphenol hydroxylase